MHANKEICVAVLIRSDFSHLSRSFEFDIYIVVCEICFGVNNPSISILESSQNRIHISWNEIDAISILQSEFMTRHI